MAVAPVQIPICLMIFVHGFCLLINGKVIFDPSLSSRTSINEGIKVRGLPNGKKKQDD